MLNGLNIIYLLYLMSLNNKRIGFELMELVNYCGPISIETHYDEQHSSKSRCIIKIMLFDLEVRIELDNNYPFSPPIATCVNNKDYIKIVCKSMPKFRVIGLENGYPKCFCCDSLLCADKWASSVHLTKLYHEIKDVIRKKLNIIHIYYCRKLATDKLTHDIPLEAYL